MEPRRVVVTGLGAVTPIGNDPETFWSNAVAGNSGITRISAFDVSDLPVQIGGEVKDWEPTDVIPPRDARRLDRFAQLFWYAADQALGDASLSFSEGDEDCYRAGVLVGSGIGGILSFQDGMDTLRSRGARRVSPYVITQIIPNMAGGVVSIAYNLYGPNIAVVTACAASANALGDAAEIIRRGDADVMIAGGAEAAIGEFPYAGFSQSRALSTRNDDPAGASRPFDADRDGFVMGEGAAVLVLEERQRALARDVRIYAELVGYGMSADAYHITLPRPGGTGAAMAMRRAVARAGIAPGAIHYINAHGTSTPANDVTETAAIKLVFGDRAGKIPISSTKSMTGHLLGGAGALESIVCVLAIRDNMVPPTINYTTPDPECDLDYVPNEARKVDVDYAMTNSFGFGGHNVALVFARH